MSSKHEHFDPVSVAAIAIAMLLAFPLADASRAGAQERRDELAEHPNETAGDARSATNQGAGSIDSMRDRLERLSEREAKQFYLGCSGAATRGRLSGGQATACSVGYDVLLQRHFGGDFHALLAWSRSQPPDSAVGSASHGD